MVLTDPDLPEDSLVLSPLGPDLDVQIEEEADAKKLLELLARLLVRD